MSEMDNRVGAYVMLGKRAVTRIMVVIRTVIYLALVERLSWTRHTAVLL